MFKVIATDAVVSKGYDNTPALKFSDRGDSVRFRIGKKVYDTRAKDNHRWVNLSVKAFEPVCERIRKMQLRDGSFVNILGRLDEDTWEDSTTHEKRSAIVVILDEIEYCSGSANSKQQREQQAPSHTSYAVPPASAQPQPNDGFEGFEPFGGANASSMTEQQTHHAQKGAHGLSDRVRPFSFAQKGETMNRKNYKKHVAYELLVVLGMSALVLFVCRLWPLLILALLGMLGAAAWLILANRETEEPEKPRAVLPSHEQNEALGRIQAQISGMVRAEHPNARWIWKTPNAKALVCSGEDASILLNRAGGYREAVVHMSNGEVENIEYLLPPEPQKGETPDEPEPEDGEAINYELVAFEWVDANVMALNERCNEGIAQGLNDILLEPTELPDRESWPEICRELERNDMDGCQCEDGGIRISLTWKRSGR